MMSLLRTLLLAVTLVTAAGLVAWPGVAWSQGEKAAVIDYTAWGKTATRAEVAIEAGRASTTALDDLRNQLSNWRQKFADARQTNANTISTIRAQLEALGPVPEDGNESVDIAVQRGDLNTRLAQLEAPIKTAELAHSRAESLIKGIDQIIRERQADEFLEFGPSPINPSHWNDGLVALFGSFGTIRDELESAWESPAQRSKTQENLPVVLLLLGVGMLLVLRGRQWSNILVRKILRGEAGAGQWIAVFVVSLGAMVLPFLGAMAVIEAVYATGLVGLRGDLFLAALLPSVFIFLVARWLAMRIFPRDDMRLSPLHLDASDKYAGRWYGALMGLVVGIFMLLKKMSEFGGWSDAASHVVLFPVLLVGALLLQRLASLMLVHCRACIQKEGGEETFRIRCSRYLARGLTLLAVVGPVLAAVGYFKAAVALMLPTLVSLILLAGLLVLQRLITEVYVLLSRNREDAADSLVPVLAGFVLIVLSLPMFALIWGARVANLTELWTRFTEGVYLGETRISPTIFITLAAVFVIGYLITRLVQGALKSTVLPKTKLDPGARNAIVAGVGYTGIFLAALVAITSAGIDLSSIALVAGALSVGIGFGLQTIVSNFVSGIILLIERPISEGDWIEVGGMHGYVRAISVRSTRIETFDRSDVIVPNSDLISGAVTNYTRGNTVGRVIVPVGVAYGADTKKIEKLLQEIAEAHPMVLANPPPNVVFQGFGASSLDFEIRAILRDVNWVLSVKSDMNHEIARRFVEEGIEIPFAQRDIWIRNPEALVKTKSPSGPAEETGAQHRHEQAMDRDLATAADGGDDDGGDGGDK